MKRIITYIYIIDMILLWLVNIYVFNNDNRAKNDSFLLAENSVILYKQEDLYNLIYVSLNNRSEPIFKCSSRYANCIDDIKSLFEDKDLLSYINSKVDVYHSYDTINISYLNNNEFKLNIKYNYSLDDINKINNKIDLIINSYINKNMNDKEKIRVIHDYLINNAIYDLDGINNKSKYQSKTAYGALFEGYAICSGYADAMSLFLNKLNIENYKISSNNHVWNMVKLNNKWYYLDVTYDAPLISLDSNIVRYDYFLKENINDKIHNYKKDLYVNI